MQSGKVTAGVVPFENSTNGSVVFTLDNLADRDGTYKDIVVDGETYVDVHHCLVGHKNPSLSESESVTTTIKSSGSQTLKTNEPSFAENHHVLDPENSKVWHDEIFRWINHYSGIKPGDW